MFEIGYQILKEFISLIFLVFPYFILGTVFGAFLEVYIRPDFIFKYLNQGVSSVINASLLGAILPGCSCATIPMAEGLRQKGARLGVIAAFIMVSPLLSPQTIILTYGLLGWKFTLARIIFSLGGAIILGILFNYLEKIKFKGFTFVRDLNNIECKCCTLEWKAENKNFLKSFLEIIKNLGKYFILGIFIASLLATLIPEETIPKYIGSSGILAYFTAALVGIPLYVCEGEEIPIALGLLKLGLGAGPSFTFILGSVGTCIPTMIMSPKIIGKKATLFYVIFWFIFAITSGLLFSLFF